MSGNTLQKAQGGRFLEAVSFNKGYQQISLNTSSASSLTVPDGAEYALIQAEAQNIRWRDDGTAPTSSVGMQLLSGAILIYTGQLLQFQAIALTSGAILNVSYYG